ncbi:MAG TPA: hypothetical protein VFZ57_12175, partial [Thermoanaerobaculia bacterium]|nr:hypothetical protein [Thermoanaerobaculia bacterium]
MTGSAGAGATRNGRAVSLRDVPWLPPSKFREWLVQGVRDQGRHVAAYFGAEGEAAGDAADESVALY